MNHFVDLLVPIDGSEASNATLDWAANTLNKTNTRFHLLTVIKILPELPSDENDVERATEILSQAKARLEAEGCSVASHQFTKGDPAEEICRYAHDHQAEFSIQQVLIGSHGRTGFNKLLLGSVSSSVLEHCEIPVFIYRNQAKHPIKNTFIGKNTLLSAL